MNDIVKSEPMNFLAVIERAALNPEIDVLKMEKLLEMQVRVMEKQAELSFNQAMARLRLPIIRHDSEINHGAGKMKVSYATYESIHKIVSPLYQAEGFSVSFDSRKNADGTTTYSGTLAHSEGHSKTAEMILPADTSGAKNNVQAIGSTISYAKRYLLSMLLNLVTTGEDDDAASASEFIELDEAAEIDMELRDLGANIPKFLEYMKAKDVQSILQKDLQKAKTMLAAKREENKKKVGAK